jgi:hypothetical protein
MMALRMAPMPLTMAMRQSPMERKMASMLQGNMISEGSLEKGCARRTRILLRPF